MSPAMDTQPADAAVARSAMAKASWRILPWIGLSYLVSYMDRTNISFAAIQMNAELGFSAAVYGLGAGIFFVGYALFEVPSNLLLARFGARRWIARIMLTWGLVSAGMMFVRTPTQFYVMRFLLGVAEAGFFPGVMLYLAAWFPNAWRGRAISRFYVAVPLAGVVTGALAGSLLGLQGLLGLGGWQWLLLCEGLPAVALAVTLLKVLPDSPDRAAWLKPEERGWLARSLAQDIAAAGPDRHGFLKALLDPVVMGVGVASGLTFAVINAVIFSAPKLLIGATGWSVGQVGLLTALGGVLTSVFMLLVGWHSDYRGERYFHVAGLIGLAAAGVTVMALAGGPALTVAGYLGFMAACSCVGMAGYFIAGDAVPPSARPVSFAALNTVAQVGAFFGPVLWGIAAERTGGFGLGLRIAPFVLVAAALLILLIRRPGLARAAAVGAASAA